MINLARRNKRPYLHQAEPAFLARTKEHYAVVVQCELNEFVHASAEAPIKVWLLNEDGQIARTTEMRKSELKMLGTASMGAL